MLGILLANITAFAHNRLAYYWPPALPGGASVSDRWIWVAQFALVDGKMRALFAMLFGAGLALMADRMDARGGFAAVQIRRLILLALFGLAHYLLLFSGDILVIYAVAGLFALLALPQSSTNLLVGGVLWAMAGALYYMAQFGVVAMSEWQAVQVDAPSPVWPQIVEYWQVVMADSGAAAEIYATGSYAEIVAYRYSELGAEIESWLTIALMETIAVMLIGMGLYRVGIFTDATVRSRYRKLAIAGVALGIAALSATGMWIASLGFPVFLTQFAFFGLAPLLGLPLVIGAMVLLTDWAETARDGWLGERLALAGRMAFSNYIGTSLVMMLVFQGWAGGLFGTMHRAELLLVVIFGWALMLTFSRVWLAKFRYGPLEWLWRCLTYLRVFPIRR